MMVPLLPEQNQNSKTHAQHCIYIRTNDKTRKLRGGRERGEKGAKNKEERREGDEIYVYAILHVFCGR